MYQRFEKLDSHLQWSNLRSFLLNICRLMKLTEIYTNCLYFWKVNIEWRKTSEKRKVWKYLFSSEMQDPFLLRFELMKKTKKYYINMPAMKQNLYISLNNFKNVHFKVFVKHDLVYFVEPIHVFHSQRWIHTIFVVYRCFAHC